MNNYKNYLINKSDKINHFYKMTGIPAVLNTSLNLHGDPISSSLEDVINTFKVSGLKYLYLEDQYLIEKKYLNKQLFWKKLIK